MPNVEELCELARLIARQEVAPDTCPEYQALDETRRKNVLALACFYIQYERRRHDGAQRQALLVLRSWLTPAQREQLRRCRYVDVTGSNGGRYSLVPGTGHVDRLERHGTREFARGVYFCLHDPEGTLPPADVTLAQLLWLVTDELGFIAMANQHPMTSTLWDSAWLRRLAASRRQQRDEAREETA